MNDSMAWIPKVTKKAIHASICRNGCQFAEKGILLGHCGDQEDWLYRCTVIGQIIQQDSVIQYLGCKTFSSIPKSKPDIKDQIENQSRDVPINVILSINIDPKHV